MANAGQAVLTIGGTIVGSFFGQPALGYAIGSYLGATLFPVKQSFTQPLSGDLNIAGAGYGSPWTRVQGRLRVGPGTPFPIQILWASAKRPIAHVTEQEAGGKGGGPTVEQTTFTDESDILIGICANESAGVTRYWQNGKMAWTNLSVAAQAELLNEDPDDPDFIARAQANLQASANSELWSRFTVYTGADDQQPDPDYEAAVGAGNAPAYRGMTTVFIKSFQLGPHPAQLPMMNFEVCTKATSGQIDADVLLLARFADNTSADESTYESVASESNVTIAGNAALIEDEESYVGWGGSHFDAPGGDPDNNPLTLEFFMTIGDLDPANTVIFFLWWINSGDDRRLLNFVQPVSGRKIRYTSVNGGNQTQVGVNDFPYNVMTHVALVIVNDGSTCEHRVYVNGVLEISVPNYPTSPNEDSGWNVIAGTRGAHSSLSQSLTIHGVRVKRGEVYTGASFTPPSGPEAWPDPLGDISVLTPQPEDLEDVVDRELKLAGLTAAQIDLTGLPANTERGYGVVGIVPRRQVLDWLATLHFFEMRPPTQKVAFVARGGASAATLDYEDLGAALEDAREKEAFALRFVNQPELPAKIVGAYLDFHRDYQSDTREHDLTLTAVAGTVAQVSFPFVRTAEEMQGVVDSMARDQAAAMARGKLALLGEHADKEPGDVLTASDSFGLAHRVRLLNRGDQFPLLEYDVVLDDASALAATGVATIDYGAAIDVSEPADTVTELLDIPIGRDADDDAGFYVAAKGAASPWAGYALHKSTDDADYARVLTATDSAVMGTCLTTLGDWDGPPVFDEKNRLTVGVGAGELSSTTRSAMLADPTINVMLIGSEVIQFRTATLVSPGVYTLSGLLRGLRGTEWAMVDHAASERCVLWRATGGIRRVPMESSELGALRYWKGVTLGRRLSTAESEQFTNTGIGKKPFSPAHVRAARAPADGEITLTPYRRSRLATRGFSSLGVSVPLGEESETYEVDVFEDDTFATVVRVLEGDENGIVYSAANQTTDFGAPVAKGTLATRTYQISATVGRGYAYEAVL